MEPHLPKKYKLKSRVPFAARIARDFGVTKGHVFRVLTGERESPRKAEMRARQAQLLARIRDRAILLQLSTNENETSSISPIAS